MEIAFWLALGLLAYTYLGYLPLLVVLGPVELLSRSRPDTAPTCSSTKWRVINRKESGAQNVLASVSAMMFPVAWGTSVLMTAVLP